MPVFKAYFKVMRGSVIPLAISLSVFMGLALLFSIMAPGSPLGLFEPTRTALAVINRDGDAPLAQGLADYLRRNGRELPLPDDPEKLQDALFYRQVEYIAIIPAGFSQDFMAGKDCAIQKVTVPDSTGSYYVDLGINRFLNTARLHWLYGGEESQGALVAATESDLAVATPVTLVASGTARGNLQGYHYYFAFCAYALLAMIITGVSSIMISFNRTELHRRNLSAPISRRSLNLQLAVGHGVFALGCWGLLVAGGLLLHGRSLLPSGLIGLYLLNTLAFAVVSTAIGFAAGTFVKSRGAQAGVINSIALGMSFLGGVFVPQAVMSKAVLGVARYLPSYWFIRANDAIGELGSFTAENLAPIYGSILIQLGFAGVIFVASLLLIRERRR